MRAKPSRASLTRSAGACPPPLPPRSRQPTRQWCPAKGHRSNIAPETWSVPGLLFPRSDSTGVPASFLPACFGRPGGGISAACSAFSRFTRPAHCTASELWARTLGVLARLGCFVLAQAVFGAHQTGSEQRASTPAPQPPPPLHTPVHHLPKDPFVWLSSRSDGDALRPRPKPLFSDC